jgi:hypothetical protein
VSLIASNRKTLVVALPKGTAQSNVEFETTVDGDGRANRLEVYMTCDGVISNHLV